MDDEQKPVKRKPGRPKKDPSEKAPPVRSDDPRYRNELGVRKQTYPTNGKGKGGKAMKPMVGTELLATYDLAIKNMKRMKAVHYETAEQLSQGIIRYWQYLKEQNMIGNALIPDVEGLSTFLGISRQTLFNLERSDKEGFRELIAQAKNDIAACKKQLGQQGMIPPIVMAMDFNNNHNYTQKQEVVVTPHNPLGDVTAAPELMAKYMDLIEDNPKQALPSKTARKEAEAVDAEVVEVDNDP